MKRIIKIFFIVYLFLASLCVNAMELNINLPQQTNAVQTLDNKNAIYNSPTENEKFLVSSNHYQTSVICQKRDNSNSAFNSFKDGVSPASGQFQLLISYIYNKSYLRDNTDYLERTFLSEISPNAP